MMILLRLICLHCSDSNVRRMVCPVWSHRLWMQATIVSLASMYSWRRRSFAVSVKSHSHSLSSNRMGAYLLQDSAASPTLKSPTLLVTLVQNRYNCSSPRILLRVSTVIDTTWCPSWQSRLVPQSSAQVICVFSSSLPSMIGMCSFETKRHEF